MSLFWKATVGVLMASVLILSVAKQEKDMALLLSMAVSIMTAAVALYFLEPVISFLYCLEELGELDNGVLTSMLKITGIALIGELAGMICQDSGNASLAKGIRFLSTAVILSLSIPILEMMMDLIQSILGGL